MQKTILKVETFVKLVRKTLLKMNRNTWGTASKVLKPECSVWKMESTIQYCKNNKKICTRLWDSMVHQIRNFLGFSMGIL